MRDAREVAERIAADLFTNGAGEPAQRLVLELEDGRYGGGWCRSAVVDRIADAIRAATPSSREAPE